MLRSTLSRLRCPQCQGELKLQGQGADEICTGRLECPGCRANYPILAGVAVLVGDVYSYLLDHVKGISRVVPDAEIPAEYRADYLEAKAEIEPEHIEEDLEAERVISLYLMNHYLRVGKTAWWKPESGSMSPLIDSLIRQHWDHGPFEQIGKWVRRLGQPKSLAGVIELGCGVGGLYQVMKPHIGSYLGVDNSFAAIALGRHLVLGVPYRKKIRIPGDLLEGPVSKEIEVPSPGSFDGSADLVVGDLGSLPVERGVWDLSVALNAIDMLNEPAVLPDLQFELLNPGGRVIQSCPYIWHEQVARKLRKALPEGVRDSARAAEWLYESAGFKIEDRVEHLPWLFFKQPRQLEIYSVHLFVGKKSVQTT